MTPISVSDSFTNSENQNECDNKVVIVFCTGLLADGTWVPMATVHFAAVTGALLAGWMAVRAKD